MCVCEREREREGGWVSETSWEAGRLKTKNGREAKKTKWQCPRTLTK